MNRVICDVLEEMRQCCKTANYGHLPGLIEEAQTMANRMEAGLGSKRDIKYREERIRELKQEIRILKHKKSVLENEQQETEYEEN